MGVYYKDLENGLYAEKESETLSRFVYPVSSWQEFIALILPNDVFYYMCSDQVDLDLYERHTGYCIVERSDSYHGYYIGRGIYHTPHIHALVANAVLEKDIPGMEKNLRSFLEFDRGKKWYCTDNEFSGSFQKEGRPCYYIHDYYPTACPEHRRKYQGMINNTLYDFKNGKSGYLVAKLMAMAVQKQGDIIRDRENTILLCIAAATAEKQERRFKEFSRRMAGYLGIEDGYDLVTVTHDRQSGDIRKGMPATENISLKDYGEALVGKHVILCDDVYTSGKSFSGWVNYLSTVDAESITGLFYGKTVHH